MEKQTKKGDRWPFIKATPQTVRPLPSRVRLTRCEPTLNLVRLWEGQPTRPLDGSCVDNMISGIRFSFEPK